VNGSPLSSSFPRILHRVCRSDPSGTLDFGSFVHALLLECGQQDDSVAPGESIRDALGIRAKREPQLEKPLPQASRERHPCSRSQITQPVDQDDNPLVLWPIKRGEPFNNFVEQLDIGRSDNIADSRLSHHCHVRRAVDKSCSPIGYSQVIIKKSSGFGPVRCRFSMGALAVLTIWGPLIGANNSIRRYSAGVHASSGDRGCDRAVD